MEQIAFIIENGTLYWNSILIALAAGTGACVFLAYYLPRGNGCAGAAAVPMTLALAWILGRFFHWYFRPDGYESFAAAMLDHTHGGFAPMGIFAACAITAGMMWLLKLECSAGTMLDAMSLGSCAGIGLGRLSCLFSAAGRGQIIEKALLLPLACPVVNAITGEREYRLAAFALQAVAAGGIFAALLVCALGKRGRPGDMTLLFLLLYGASQALLDSTRYDSLYLRSNGFLRADQLLGAVAMVAAAVVYAIRAAKRRGFRWWFVLLWLPMAAGLAAAGFMEYYVQRHGDRAIAAYAGMSAALAVFVAAALVLRRLGRAQ